MSKKGGECGVISFQIQNIDIIHDAFGPESLPVLYRDVANIVKQERNKLVCASFFKNGKFSILYSGGSRVGEQLCAAIGRNILNFQFGRSQKFSISINCGLACYPIHGEIHDLLTNSEYALRISNSNGLNHVSLYDNLYAKTQRKNAILSNELCSALKLNQLKLFYQPKIDANTLQITAMEALIRWFHPTHGVLLPESFIPMAEKMVVL